MPHGLSLAVQPVFALSLEMFGGALAMVKELLDTPGAAQESDVFAFVSDVEADQRMEIDRMGSMLASLASKK